MMILIISFKISNVKKMQIAKKRELDESPTMHVCNMSVKSMKNNKSPGQQRLKTELYKMFWKDI